MLMAIKLVPDQIPYYLLPLKATTLGELENHLRYWGKSQDHRIMPDYSQLRVACWTMKLLSCMYSLSGPIKITMIEYIYELQSAVSMNTGGKGLIIYLLLWAFDSKGLSRYLNFGRGQIERGKEDSFQNAHASLHANKNSSCNRATTTTNSNGESSLGDRKL